MSGPTKRQPDHHNSEVLDRQPPQAREAERAVMGSIVLFPEVLDEVSLLLKERDFFDSAHQVIYRHCLELYESAKLDATLLLESLKKAGELELVGGSAYVLEVARAVPTAAHAVHYAKIVRGSSMLRGLIESSTEVLRDAYEPGADPQSLIESAEERIYSLQDSQQIGEVISLREAFHESIDRLQRMEGGGSRGISTGYDDLDTLTGGLQESELIVLAARPSMGKSALALNIAENVSRGGDGVLFASLEMSAIELADRMLSTLARVSSTKMRQNTMNSDERQRLLEAAAEFAALPLYVNDKSSQTVSQIASNARRLKRNGGNLKLIVIDYLQLIEPDNPRDPRQEQVAKISRRLKGLAKDLNVPIIVLAQLNRLTESAQGNRPRLSHLRESGAIEQDADTVWFVHREEYYCTDEESRREVAGQAEVIISKQRNGPTGDVKLTWLKEFMRFENAARPNHTDEFDSWNDREEDYSQMEAF